MSSPCARSGSAFNFAFLFDRLAPVGTCLNAYVQYQRFYLYGHAGRLACARSYDETIIEAKTRTKSATPKMWNYAYKLSLPTQANCLSSIFQGMECLCDGTSLLLGESEFATEEEALGKLEESTCVDSSSSSWSTLDCVESTFSRRPSLPKAGDASPSTICQRRKLSTAIAKSVESRHPFLTGRPAMVLNSTDVLPPPPPPVPRPKQKLHRAESAPSGSRPGSFRTEPPPLRLDAWAEPAAETFNVRGKNYAKDGKKYPSDRAAFSLLTVDMVNSKRPICEGMCAHPTERFQLARKRERDTGITELPPFVFAVNLCIPGAINYHQVSYFGISDMEEIERGKTPFGRVMRKFIFGDSDQFRNDTFKLIPRIAEGNYVVRAAVGAKPSIIGKKIKQYYIRGDRYFEMVVDISSEPMAQRIVKLALGFAKSLVVDMMFVLEGTDEDTLPERIFGGVQLRGIDFEKKDGKRTVTPIRWG
eukprot:scaffold25278_cov132-Cylindrotheca_fusiformis.AAC.2